MKKKILVISVGRSDYDRYLPIIDGLQKSKKINLSLFLTTAHYNKKLGYTANFVSKKFKIIKNNKKTNFKDEMNIDFSEDLKFLSSKIKNSKPDIMIVLGDRYEMLVGPIAAAPYNIPVIHFYGGAVTEGAIDELVRHAITKMSHLHFVILEDYRKRLIQMGEEAWRVKNIGMHQLQFIKSQKKKKISELSKKFKFNFSKPYVLMTFHPVTIELSKLNSQLSALAKAIKLSGYNCIITYPNADPQYKKIINFLQKIFDNKEKYKVIKNLGIDYYSSVLENSKFIIGNSSSGIVEAATFKKPAINVGSRQKGKFMTPNVINAKNDKNEILKKIRVASSDKFRKKIKNIKNPYESKININTLIKIILNIKINDKLIRKKFVDKS